MNTFRTAAIASAAIIGVAVGGYGISSATTSPTDPAPAPAPAHDDNDGSDEMNPRLDGSIQVDEVEGQSETAEAARLAGLATVSEAAAVAAVSDDYPGDLSAAELGNENGSLVWELTVARPDGTSLEVKVDAGNGSILDIEDDDDDNDQ